MLTRLRLFALPFALLVAACGQNTAPPGPSPDGVDMRGSSVGGDFTLTSSKGQEANWADFQGQYRMVYFGFTSCPAICPTDVLRMSQALDILEQDQPAMAAKITPIFITIDSERDTPEVIEEFIGNFHPRLVGLTGNADQLMPVLAQFGTSAMKLEPDETGFYDMQHSTFVTLFDPDGKPLGILPSDKGAEAMAAELAGWVR